jgi:hypothetical protein
MYEQKESPCITTYTRTPKKHPYSSANRAQKQDQPTYDGYAVGFIAGIVLIIVYAIAYAFLVGVRDGWWF